MYRYPELRLHRTSAALLSQALTPLARVVRNGRNQDQSEVRAIWAQTEQFASVTAPRLLELTRAAYFANTPRVSLAAGACQV